MSATGHLGVNTAAVRATPPRRWQSWVRRLAWVSGEVMVTLGVVCLLLVVYELWITGLFAAATQGELHQSLSRRWAGPVATPAPGAPPPRLALGSGIAILRIPLFGPSFDPVIVQGVGDTELSRGPGHYPGTALPGQIGNFVVSGHRTTWGHWFYSLNDLHPGAVIGVETQRHWYLYRVTSQEIVTPTDLAVVAPVADRPGVTPTQAEITLTTCNPLFSASQRLIVHGVLTQTLPRTAALPAALAVG